jgi:hypothetical protein
MPNKIIYVRPGDTVELRFIDSSAPVDQRSFRVWDRQVRPIKDLYRVWPRRIAPADPTVRFDTHSRAWSEPRPVFREE